MKSKLKFKVGKKYYSNIEEDNFIVKRIDRKENIIGIRFENGTHGYCVNDDGNTYFGLGFLEELLNIGESTLVEPEKTENK